MRPTVRPAAVSDAPALGRIRVAAWRAAYRGLVAQDVLDGLEAETEAGRFAARMHADPAVRVAVAVSGEDVVAYCIHGPDRDEPSPGRSEVYAIYANPSRWRRGVGSLLLDTVVADLVAQGRTELRLWTLAGNHAARRFYEDRGWVADGAERGLATLPAPDGAPVREIRYVRAG